GASLSTASGCVAAERPRGGRDWGEAYAMKDMVAHASSWSARKHTASLASCNRRRAAAAFVQHSSAFAWNSRLGFPIGQWPLYGDSITSPRGLSAAPTHARRRSSRPAGALRQLSTVPRVRRIWALAGPP